MSRPRDDDELDELVSDLSTTLADLQDVLADERGGSRSRRQRRSRLPSPDRFLRFTEEHTIPTLISLLETNIRALELFGGLLRLINGRDDRQRSGTNPFGGDRRVQRTGRRTLDAVDSALSDLQGAMEGEPTDSEARSLLDDARSLRGEIDDRLSDPSATREQTQSDDSDHSDRSNDRENNGAVSIDVTDGESDASDDNQNPDDEVNVDDELETIKQNIQDDDEDDESPSS
jgi:hypothetical protein